MNTEQAHFLLHDVLLPGVKNEQRITQNIIEAIPLDQGNFRPDSIAKTAFEMAWHLASIEIFFLSSVATGAFVNPGARPDSVTNTKEVAAWYATNFEAQMAKFASLPDEELTKIMDFRGVFQLPAVMYLDFLMHHSIHHRGQLTMYLRPMGAKVPSVYGESYDATEARKAAQTTS